MMTSQSKVRLDVISVYIESEGKECQKKHDDIEFQRPLTWQIFQNDVI